jgi:hypothetical protein
MRKIYHSHFSSFFKYHLRCAIWPKYPSEYKLDDINQISTILCIHRIRTYFSIDQCQINDQFDLTVFGTVRRPPSARMATNRSSVRISLCAISIRSSHPQGIQAEGVKVRVHLRPGLQQPTQVPRSSEGRVNQRAHCRLRRPPRPDAQAVLCRVAALEPAALLPR